jgi:hypothetical protein
MIDWRFFAFAISLQKISMQTKRKDTLPWWLLLIGSTVALLFAIAVHWEWLTLILPFQCTAFVKALDIV